MMNRTCVQISGLEIGRWSETCLAEDFEYAVRMWKGGKRIAVLPAEVHIQNPNNVAGKGEILRFLKSRPQNLLARLRQDLTHLAGLAQNRRAIPRQRRRPLEVPGKQGFSVRRRYPPAPPKDLHPGSCKTRRWLADFLPPTDLGRACVPHYDADTSFSTQGWPHRKEPWRYDLMRLMPVERWALSSRESPC